MWIFELMLLSFNMALKISSQSSLINIHQLVFISRPDHMQITPDTKGYLSILSQHTVPTWLLATLVRGTHINDMNTSPVLKQQKKVPLNSQQNTANGYTARCEPHSTGMTADRPGESVNCSCTPPPPAFQQEEEKQMRAKSRQLRLFGLKCLRLKRTQASLRTKSSGCDGFRHSGSKRCGIFFHCRLN